MAYSNDMVVNLYLREGLDALVLLGVIGTRGGSGVLSGQGLCGGSWKDKTML